MHANGQGVRQDYMEALRLYRLAALQGDRMAQNNLAALYYLGQGTAEDNVRAYMWFSLAFMNGMTRAGQNRDAIAGMMTPAEIAQAQDMAQQCSVSGYMQCE
jgi:TPR repeat protein